ncbi:hypothetical protein HF086_002480 [Spodoptera exigua]|uniref:Gelsolin-like domain-containing protein n=1 Tax=Spodoptera exigua TaxID=7107 RepID=A0A922MEZ8_SPOEX|nr:hypothetical protein HF086_002480 [Spodoptera exigua]
MDHPAFAEAGANPGIEIWTIEQFEPVAVPSKSYGKFYNGDSYIVLKTSGQSNATLSYDAHFWLGRGNESGFTEVETNAGAEKRLLKLSGCENMRIEETYYRDDISAVYLYRVMLGDDFDVVALNKPYKQSHLTSDVNVTKVSEGSECSTFKQYFISWNTVITRSMGPISDSDAGYDSDDAEQTQKVAQYIGKSAAAREYMPDNGEGSLTVTRVPKHPLMTSRPELNWSLSWKRNLVTTRLW